MAEAGQDMYIDTIGTQHLCIHMIAMQYCYYSDDTYVATDVQSVGESD